MKGADKAGIAKGTDKAGIAKDADRTAAQDKGGKTAAAGVAGGQGVQVDDVATGTQADARSGAADRRADDRKGADRKDAGKGSEPKPVTDSQRQVEQATAATAAGVAGGAAAGATTAGVAGGQGVQVDEATADQAQTAEAAGKGADRKVTDKAADRNGTDRKVTDKDSDRQESQGSGAGTAAVVGGTAVAGGAVAAGAAAQGARTDKAEAPKEGSFGAQTLTTGTDVPGTEKDSGDLMEEPIAGHTADGTKIETVTDKQLKAQSEGEQVDDVKAQPATTGAAGTAAATGAAEDSSAQSGAGKADADKADKAEKGDDAGSLQSHDSGSEYEKAAQRDGYAVTGVPGYAGPVSERAQREIAEDEKAAGGSQLADEKEAAQPMTGSAGSGAGTAGSATGSATGTAGSDAGTAGSATAAKDGSDRRAVPAEETLGEAHTPAADRPVQAGGVNSGGLKPGFKDNLIETAKGAASVAAKGAAKGAEAGAKGAVKGASFLRDKLAQAQERRWKGRK